MDPPPLHHLRADRIGPAAIEPHAVSSKCHAGVAKAPVNAQGTVHGAVTVALARTGAYANIGTGTGTGPGTAL